MTRKVITIKDMQFAAEGLAYNGQVCHEVLKTPALLAKFTPTQVVALKAYRQDCVKSSSRFYKAETLSIMSEASKLKIDPREAIVKLTDLVNLMEPMAKLDLSKIDEDNSDDDLPALPESDDEEKV